MKNYKILIACISILMPLTLITSPIHAKELSSEDVSIQMSEENLKLNSTNDDIKKKEIPKENLKNGFTVEEAFCFDKSTGTITGYDSSIGGYDVIIPSEIDGITVTNIGVGAFYNKNLTSVTIPNSVVSINSKTYWLQKGAFENNNLTSVKIGNSVTHIGNYAFADNKLTNVEIPNSVTYIGDYTFENNNLTNVEIPENVIYIEDYTFFNNNLTSITIPDNVEYLGDYTFADNKLTSVKIGNSVTSIGNGSFYNNKLTSVTIPNSVISINERADWSEKGAFENNNLTSVQLGNSVDIIGEDAFAGNQLTSITIPDSVSQIKRTAFKNNNLTSITIPDSVEYLGDYIINNNIRKYVSYEIKANKYIINLKKLDPMLDIKKVSNVEGGTYDSNTGIITLPEKPSRGYSIKYVYEVSNSNVSSEYQSCITLYLDKEITDTNLQDEVISDVVYSNLNGIILEGNIGTDKLFDKNIKKSILVKSKDGQVKLEKNIENTDKYGNGYSGFKAILSKDDFDKIGNLIDGTIEIKIEYNGEVITLPYNINPTNKNSRMSTGYFDWESTHYKIENFPSIELGKNTVSIKVDSNNRVLLNNKVNDYGINLLAYYLNKNRYVLDLGIECGKFDMSTEKHENTFEIKDLNGNIVYTGTVATFTDGAYNLPSKTALQIIVPAKYSTDEYNIELIVKDENGVEQYRFTNFPKWN